LENSVFENYLSIEATLFQAAPDGARKRILFISYKQNTTKGVKYHTQLSNTP